MSDFTVSFVQVALQWHDVAANQAELTRLINLISIPTDLIVLPEMFSTGFSMAADTLAEPLDGPTMQWMRTVAAQRDAVVTGSLIIQTEAGYHNRLIWMRPDGSYSHYDKRHLFHLAKESHTYQTGQALLEEEWRGWRIRPLICYDLRFPVWSRNLAAQPYDLLLYIANWPAVRRTAWMTLLRARAIENLAYTLGVNCVGLDLQGQHYAGDSALLDMKGEYLVEVGNQETCITRTLRRQELLDFRQRFPALADGETFTIQPRAATAPPAGA